MERQSRDPRPGTEPAVVDRVGESDTVRRADEH